MPAAQDIFLWGLQFGLVGQLGWLLYEGVFQEAVGRYIHFLVIRHTVPGCTFVGKFMFKKRRKYPGEKINDTLECQPWLVIPEWGSW